MQIVTTASTPGGGMPQMPVIFQPQSGLFDLVHGDHIYRVDDHMREIRVIHADGTLERIIRFERTFPDLAAQFRGTSLFSGITVDDNGQLWLRQGPAGAPDGMARWLVLDREGVPRHSVDLPARWNARGHRGMTISADAISTAESDDLMVQTIVAAPLRRP